jgi:hypothetical protein
VAGSSLNTKDLIASPISRLIITTWLFRVVVSSPKPFKSIRLEKAAFSSSLSLHKVLPLLVGGAPAQETCGSCTTLEMAGKSFEFKFKAGPMITKAAGRENKQLSVCHRPMIVVVPSMETAERRSYAVSNDNAHESLLQQACTCVRRHQTLTSSGAEIG